LGAVLSFGQDPRWRRFLVSRIPDATPLVLDVATGTGAVAARLHRAGKAGTVVGLDQSEPMLREAARRLGGTGARFVIGQAELPPLAPGSFDGLTVTYLLRYVDDPGVTLASLAALVRPGGVIASLEFGVPPAPWALACWRLYTRAVMPIVGRLVSPAWFRVGRFLGPSIERFWADHPLQDQLQMWDEAGIGAVRWRRMSNGAGFMMWGVRTG